MQPSYNACGGIWMGHSVGEWPVLVDKVSGEILLPPPVFVGWCVAGVWASWLLFLPSRSPKNAEVSEIALFANYGCSLNAWPCIKAAPIYSAKRTTLVRCEVELAWAALTRTLMQQYFEV